MSFDCAFGLPKDSLTNLSLVFYGNAMMPEKQFEFDPSAVLRQAQASAQGKG